MYSNVIVSETENMKRNETGIIFNHLAQRKHGIYTSAINVDATPWCCADVQATLYKRHVPSGTLMDNNGN